jgi:hypothetical protein
VRAKGFPPHLQIEEGLVRVHKGPSISTPSGEPIEAGDWSAPDPVTISIQLEVDELRLIRRSCGLAPADELVAVLQVSGVDTRSRLTLDSAPIRRKGILCLEGTVPEGAADVSMSVGVTIQLAHDSNSAPPAPRRRGAIVWEHEDVVTLGELTAQLRVVREDFKGRSYEAVPWFADIELGDLDRPFTEAVVIRVNSSHPLGKQVDTNARGPLGSIEKRIRIQMYNDIERQLLITALCDGEVRARSYVEGGESLGDVLRHRISVSMPNRDPEAVFRRFQNEPLWLEMEMVRQRYGAR